MERRRLFVQEAGGLARKFRAFVAGDPVLQEIDANGLIPLKVHKTLTDTLTILANRLGG